MTATVIALGDRDERQLTHRELDATLALIGDGIAWRWVATDSAAAQALDGVDGVWLVPGSPYRDDGAAYGAIAYCLRTGTPYLGTCAGFQYACVALARALAGIAGAAHAESDPEGETLVVAPLACSLYGERRLVAPAAGTRLAEICSTVPFSGFHWCGYGLAPAAEQLLLNAGVVLSARA